MSMTICILTFRFPASQQMSPEVFKPHDSRPLLLRPQAFAFVRWDAGWWPLEQCNECAELGVSDVFLPRWWRWYRISCSTIIIRTSCHHNISEIQGTTSCIVHSGHFLCLANRIETPCGKVTKRPISRRILDPEGKQSGKTSRMNIETLLISLDWYFHCTTISIYTYHTTIEHLM